MARGQNVKAIEEAIVRLEADRALAIASFDGRIEGLKQALRLHTGAASTSNPFSTAEKKRIRRGNLKETVLSLAQEVAENGMSSEECITLAKERGIDLVPGSVSSLLSRLKNDGVVFFDGQRYRLKEYAGPRQAA